MEKMMVLRRLPGQPTACLKLVILTGLILTLVPYSLPVRAAAPTPPPTQPATQGTIVFVDDETGLPQILTMEPDGGTSASALTNRLPSDHGPANLSPGESPDAQKSAFVSGAKASTA